MPEEFSSGPPANFRLEEFKLMSFEIFGSLGVERGSE